MRKLILTAAMLAVALGGAAGCADNSGTDTTTPSPSVSPAASSSTSDTAAQTKAVCTEATAVGATSTAALQATVLQLSQYSSDPAKVQSLAAELIKTANAWSAKLTELSKKPITPQVKKVLEDSSATITALAASTNPNVSDIQAKLADLSTKLKAACA